MGTEVLGILPFQNQLEMGGMICGRLRQPAMRSLEGEWGGATQETRNDGGGTRQGMVQDDEGGNREGKRKQSQSPSFLNKGRTLE